jgi:hypothetical protein
VNIARWPLIAAAELLLTPARIDGITEVMTDADITRAFAVANGSESRRASFHAAYVVDVADAVIEHLEVITEFRRFVLAAEDQLISIRARPALSPAKQLRYAACLRYSAR